MSSPTDATSPKPSSSRLNLETERLFLHAMLDSSADYIYFKDTQSRFLCINHALAAYFELKSPAEAVGKTDFDFYPAERAREQGQDECRIMETGKPVTEIVTARGLLDPMELERLLSADAMTALGHR